ncbi:hypothetical protein SYNPS1DRAFT_29693 [Syncephalis pseudoplumigaleata]|uniref:Uncharacterized protein n=1 Tax=Syncephalis pseudoplumigaleata TaxID=1712513 RepID=A0A4P9YXF0_9FUNG|nr:hypothetical protein SYNPS1DRAFT_29693 [Syncephalis pseudoplumigaleata]|eukprot:RKP24545.1 hypothetical protein SYNPS1DRAFT_29693 [Syncephalis pseudoplumigaleata]
MALYSSPSLSCSCSLVLSLSLLLFFLAKSIARRLFALALAPDSFASGTVFLLVPPPTYTSCTIYTGSNTYVGSGQIVFAKQQRPPHAHRPTIAAAVGMNQRPASLAAPLIGDASAPYRTPANSRDSLNPPLGRHSTTPPSTGSSPAVSAATKPVVNMDMPLRDILAQYTHNEDILRLVLTAKIEEDKRYAAQANAQAEQARLASRRVELEMAQWQPPSRTRMTRSATDFHPMRPTHPGRSVSSELKRPHMPEHRNSLPVVHSYGSPHRTHGSPENDIGGNGTCFVARSNAPSNPAGSYAAPSFTDCLAFSPADMTHMPPLPMPAGPQQQQPPPPPASTEPPALNRSHSAYASSGGSRSTEATITTITASANSSSEHLTPTTLKRRQHEEAMRTVRERVLSKRRALSYHNDGTGKGLKSRGSHDSLQHRTRDPREISPSHPGITVSMAASLDDRAAVTLPPLTVAHASLVGHAGSQPSSTLSQAR